MQGPLQHANSGEFSERHETKQVDEETHDSVPVPIASIGVIHGRYINLAFMYQPILREETENQLNDLFSQ